MELVWAIGGERDCLGTYLQFGGGNKPDTASRGILFMEADGEARRVEGGRLNLVASGCLLSG